MPQTKKPEIKKKKKITIDVKKEIIDRHEKGMRIADIARVYGKSTSTICTILKKKEEIKDLETAKGVTRVSKQRPPILEVIEKLLLVWINERQVAGEAVTENLVCEKAKALYADIISKVPGTSSQNVEEFKASRGWYHKFKRRSGFSKLQGNEESWNSGPMIPDMLATVFRNFIINECYLPQQVFNCVETRLFWKKLPKRTYIVKEENKTPGVKTMEDHFSLLLCANASGDFRVKPLLVYHSENPRAFKQCKVKKNQLSVMWRSNSKAWVTSTLFIEWVYQVFGPSVKKYLLENNLPLRVLLVVDNSPFFPPDLENELPEEFQFIKILLFPPSIISLLQSLNQEIISNFKKFYTKSVFQQCFEVTQGTDLTLRQFWKNHFHIVNCLKLVTKAWDELSKTSINYAWRQLWPECVDKVSPVKKVSVMEEILFLGKSLGLEVNEHDIEECLEEHNQEPTTGELMELYYEERQDKMKENDEAEISPDPNEIKKMCLLWDKLQNFVEQNHPNKTDALDAINYFDDNVMSHFRKILLETKECVSAEVFCHFMM